MAEPRFPSFTSPTSRTRFLRQWPGRGRRSPTHSPASQPNWPVRPPRLFIPAPQAALHPGPALWSRPPSGLRPPFTPIQPKASWRRRAPCHGSPAVRDPRAVAPLGASLALPACPSFEPPSLVEAAPGPPPLALRPLLAARADPSGLRRSLSCGSLGRSVSLAPETPVVGSLPSALGRQTGRGAPSLSASPPAPFPRSQIRCPPLRPSAWPPESRPLWRVRQILGVPFHQSGSVAPGLASWP